MLKFRKIIIICIVNIFILTIFSKVLAIEGFEKVSVEKKTHITITFCPNMQPASNVEFQIYKVADISENYEFSLTESFKKYPISLDNIGGDEWDNLARNISYICNSR